MIPIPPTAADLDELSVSRVLIADQREANQHLVGLALRAQELTEIAGDALKRAEASLLRAEASEAALLAYAELRETFIGVLGHDLRNPLSSIMLLAGALLARVPIDPVVATKATRILTSGQRMSRMIKQLLDLTRSRLGGGMSLHQVPTDLAYLAREVVAEFDARAVALEVRGDVSGIWDPDRLAEVLSNIAGNAIEHATPGTPVVIELASAAAAVTIRIRNQGHPINPEILETLFEPFRQGSPNQRSPNGNLGLGLYISSEIVHGHGGTITARSAGGTTTFAIELPRHPPLPETALGSDRRPHPHAAADPAATRTTRTAGLGPGAGATLATG